MLFTFKYFLRQFSTTLLLIVVSSNLTIAAELAEPTSPLTLEAALGFAVRANPSIAVAQREREAIEGPLWQYIYAIEIFLTLLIAYIGIKSVRRNTDRKIRNQNILITCIIK